MPTASNDNPRAAQRGALPSVVAHFSIHGLYGYRDISLNANHAATILIAKNGSGKTTLLGALDAFLKCQFSRLRDIQFTSIQCQFRDQPKRLELQRADLVSWLSLIEDDVELLTSSRRFGVESSALLEFIAGDYVRLRKRARELAANDVFEKIVTKVGYNSIEARRVCDRILESVREKNKPIDEIRDAILSAVGDTEIVYLPTYRRLELPLAPERPEEEGRSSRRRSNIYSKLGISKRGLHNADIQFGLSDISERLAELNQEILFSSNQEYREISAKIINELLDGTFERALPAEAEIPEQEALELFFSRLKNNKRNIAFRHFPAPVPDLEKVYGQKSISPDSNKFLRYFLSKLNTVIAATKGIELQVEEFVENCNRYLSSYDPTTAIPERGVEAPTSSRTNADEKVLKLDRNSLTVRVESIGAQRVIPLDALSSGEKQMISLFARLYLYSGKKIVLIDEPELSLSLDWQQKLLLDVVNAPSCVQFIAITHSPFVFANELEPFAKSLSVGVRAPHPADAEMDIEDESGS